MSSRHAIVSSLPIQRPDPAAAKADEEPQLVLAHH